MDYNDKNYWEIVYKENYLQAMECVEKFLLSNNVHEIEYWYILMHTSAFTLLRHYFNSKGINCFKPKDVLSCAINEKLITDENGWMEAVKLSERIGRAIKEKDENIPAIKKSMNLYHNLAKVLENLF